MGPSPYIAKIILTLPVSGGQTKIRKVIKRLKGSTCVSRIAGVLWLKPYKKKLHKI